MLTRKRGKGAEARPKRETVNRIAVAASLIVLVTLSLPAGLRAGTDPALLHPATLTAKAPARYDVTMKTTAGTFVVAVTRAWAPRGADRFYALVKHGFFTDAAFFRVVPGFVVQFGLSANPAVSAAWGRENLKDDPVTKSNRAGYLSFASAGPNTRTTQIFIDLGDNARLDAMGFAPFGKIATGLDVVRKIYSGYGESPDQSAIESKGKAYLDQNFPALDRIISATIVSPVPSVRPSPKH
jgi:cyclophilin family peptidyl-prolyl cis-trans isomerase